MAKERGFARNLFLVCVLWFIISPSGMEQVTATQVKLIPEQLINQEAKTSIKTIIGASHDDIDESSLKKGSSHSTKAPPSSLTGSPKKLNDNTTTWCVVKPSTSPEKLDQIIHYCCTQINVNCSVIQAGGMCYYPLNKISDAAVVMNIYYRISGKNVFNCDFTGSGLIVDKDPSVGKCIYEP